MQEKSDLLMQELFGELATKTMVVYQQSKKERQESEDKLQSEISGLKGKIEAFNSERDRLLEELKKAFSEVEMLKTQLKDQKYSTDMYTRFWREEQKKNNELTKLVESGREEVENLKEDIEDQDKIINHLHSLHNWPKGKRKSGAATPDKEVSK